MSQVVPSSVSPLTRLRRRTYEILDGAVVDRASHACEIFIASLVVANVIAIILESVQDIHDAYEAYFHIFDLASVVVFSCEYVLRVWSYSENTSSVHLDWWTFSAQCPSICNCFSPAPTCGCCACSA
jgi:uncharacterized membrane protein